jgi:hypothetical protein
MPGDRRYLLTQDDKKEPGLLTVTGLFASAEDMLRLLSPS